MIAELAEVVMEEALRAGDVVGGSGGGAHDGFGAYGIVGIVAVIVIPRSNGRRHVHAVLALAPVRISPPPVCERAAAVVH